MYRFPASVGRNGPITSTAIRSNGVLTKYFIIFPRQRDFGPLLETHRSHLLHQLSTEIKYFPDPKQHLLDIKMISYDDLPRYFTFRNNNMFSVLRNNRALSETLQQAIFYHQRITLCPIIFQFSTSSRNRTFSVNFASKSAIHLHLVFDLQSAVSHSTCRALLFEFSGTHIFQGLLFSCNACNHQHRVFLTTHQRYHVRFLSDVQ